MYNRYIPQADGSFRRSRVPEPVNNPQRPDERPPDRQEAVPKEPAPKPNAAFAPQPRSYGYQNHSAPSPRNVPYHDSPPVSVGSFLKGLLPQNFDTEDLIVVLLLLLMSGNSSKDQNAALLTLVIYLFL
ncbi:MAG: hypothetical protein PUK18_10670 [Firmicutes bacterium]|nr:hypothetical protein [Bacillota bacterium]MDY6161367.1 hypothetical protein [Candidatus Faecousia sp.]